MESFIVLVHGTYGVGSRQIIYQFVYEKLFEPHPIFEHRHKRVFNVDNKPVELELNHLGKCVMWRDLDESIQRSDGFVLTYAINDRKSFDEVKERYRRIVHVKRTKNVPIVLCGNRCDLDDQRVVSRTEGEELAKDLGAIFIEASAFANIHINTVFKAIVREIRKKAIPKEQRAGAKQSIPKEQRAEAKKVNKDRDKQCTLL